jgi:hypothetical protein
MAEFNVGRDWVIDVFDPLLGGVQSFSIMTGWSKSQNTTRIQSRGIDGTTRIRDLRDTWEGTVTFDRANPAIDNYFAAREQADANGQDLPPCSITETIREDGGGISQFRYTGVALTLAQGGDARGDSKIEMTINWIATRRLKVI